MKPTKIFLNTLLTVVLIASVFLFSTPMVHAQTDQEWSIPVNLSNSGASKSPLMVVDSDGVIHVIWVDEFDGYKYTMSKDGVTWTTPITVKFPFLPENEPPRFEVTANGIIHVFWIDENNTLYYVQTQQASFDSPSSWRSLVRLGVSVVDYDVALDAADGLHVSYITNDDTGNERAGVYFRSSLNGGSSWTDVRGLFESPYFRALTTANAHVRVAASETANAENVYVVWDNLALKRIFMAKSLDRGHTWDDPSEIIGPELNSGYETPYNIEVDAIDTGVLLTWQTGESGIRCAQYSRWSSDGGNQWGEIVRMFDDLGVCPERIGFNVVNDDYAVAVLNIEENLAVIAWNGNVWSNLQIQNELSSLSNPVTFDPIIFHCQDISLRNETIFVVGCDEGDSEDVWYLSRPLGTVENWFPPPSEWGSPQDITNVSQHISSISSVADINNNIHAVWVQSPLLDDDTGPAIYYARWDGNEWSMPAQIIVTNGLPVHLSLATSNQDRLFLVWVDEVSGDLLFSWGNSSRANIPLEWAPPVILPSLARLVSSPDILVDGSGNIVVSYAVPLNEDRGIYMVRSNNLGETWSAPSRIFDAVSAEWDATDRPKLALTVDGRLHALFSKYSVSGGIQPMGLYYSQSEDGGNTWSDPTELSDKAVDWHKILVDNNQTLHLLWQENYGQIITNYHRISVDSGLTWNNPLIVSSTREKLVMIDSEMDVGGQLHLLQFVVDSELSIQEWVWDGSHWSIKESRAIFSNVGDPIPQEFLAEITPNGNLGVLTILEMGQADNILESRLTGTVRHIDITSPGQATLLAIIPTSALSFNPTTVPGVQPTSTALSPLAGVDDSAPVINKNAVGLIMIVGVLILLVVVIRPRQSNKRG